MRQKIKVAVLTGKRGGFGAMKPMLRRFRDSGETELQLIVTDQHLNPAFGATRTEVEEEFEIAAAVDMHQAGDSGAQRAAALGRCLTGMSEALAHLRPDVLLLYGDRGEVLSAAVAALHDRLPVGHMQGGDVSGNVDEAIRHAVTKLSHLHFPSCEASAQRIKQLGEEPWRIEVVGDNHIDPIIAGAYTGESDLRLRYDIPTGVQPVLVLLHPETIRGGDQGAAAATLYDAVIARSPRTIMVYPCSDHGYRDIVRELETRSGRPGVSVHKNIPAPDFAGLMRISRAIVGNSSAALVEAPYFGLPALNVGVRQQGRMCAENVLNCDFEADLLEAAVDKVLGDADFRHAAARCSRPYGDGRAGERIYERILRTDFSDPALLNKRLTY